MTVRQHIKSTFLENENMIAFSLFIISLLVYISTSSPAIYLGDSGEFVTNSFTLGINHRPGYPLYTLLGRLFIMLFFFLKPVFIMNVLSGIFTSVSIAFTYKILRELDIQKIVSFSSSLILAFSLTLWSRSTIAEVYSLNILFTSIALYFYLVFDRTKKIEYYYLMIYIIALGLLQNLNGVIAAAVLLIFFFATNIHLIKPRVLLTSFLIGVVGISIYVYLHYRSTVNPPMDFKNPEGLSNLINYLAPGYIVGIATASGESTNSNFSWLVSQIFFKEYSYIIILAFGVLVGKIIHKKFLILFLLLFISNIIYNSKSHIKIYGDLDAYFLPAFYIIVILIALGIANIQKIIIAKSPTLITGTALNAIIVALPIFLFFNNYSLNDRSNYYFGEELGKSMTASLEPNSVLIPQWDEAVNISYYLKYVEKYREDLYLIPPAFLSNEWVNQHYPESFRGKDYSRYDKHQLLSILINSYREAPIYFSSHLTKPVNSTEYKLVPHGIVEKLIKNEESDNDELYHSFTHDYDNVSFDIHSKYIIDLYLDRILEHALYQSDKGNYKNSIKSHKAFLEFPNSNNHVNYVDVLASIGINSYILQYYDESIHYLKQALELKSDHYLLTTLGRTYLAVGDTTNAIANFSYSYKLNNNTTAKKLLEKYSGK